MIKTVIILERVKYYYINKILSKFIRLLGGKKIGRRRLNFRKKRRMSWIKAKGT